MTLDGVLGSSEVVPFTMRGFDGAWRAQESRAASRIVELYYSRPARAYTSRTTRLAPIAKSSRRSPLMAV